MKKIILIIIAIFAYIATFSQTNEQFYTKYFNTGVTYYSNHDFLSALEYFDLAYEFANTEKQKIELDRYKTYCRNGAKQQQIDLQNALKRSDSLFNVAQDMQLKMETAIFDKSIKSLFPDWKGYTFYDWEDANNGNTQIGLYLLQNIDSLDFSYNSLLRIPKETGKCPNLKFINLLSNPNINWQQSASILKSLDTNIEIYSSFNDLNEINMQYRRMVTGVEIVNKGLATVPQNILQQKQLKYLNLSKNHFAVLSPQIFNLINLTNLNLSDIGLKIIPTEIKNLNNLTELNLSSNLLVSLNPELFSLINLTSLNLSNNQLNSLPPEISNLKNLTYLDLSGNQLTKLPPEIISLRNLKVLNLSNNQLTELPDEICDLENLQELYLFQTQIKNLPKRIGNLKNLRKLFISSPSFKSIPDDINQLQNLKELYITSKKMSKSEKQKIRNLLPKCRIN